MIVRAGTSEHAWSRRSTRGQVEAQLPTGAVDNDTSIRQRRFYALKMCCGDVQCMCSGTAGMEEKGWLSNYGPDHDGTVVLFRR